ncbi:DUF805 domain-containing protein [Roseomonas sp. CAU 1739]|uniref:DUF805 domain-containing protein n=1 Tax=Roseomonas sp. CAU 1739 TaxID=3140364 RepID=UPI00325B847E
MTIGAWLSFRGRIGRQSWWLAYLLPMIAVSAVVGAAYSTSVGMAAPGMSRSVGQQGLLVLSALLSLLSIWPMLVGAIKRMHDRNRSGWWIGAQTLLLGSLVLLTWQVDQRGRLHDPIVAAALIGAAAGVGVLSLWVFIEINVLRGTRGFNRFGPDPLVTPDMALWQQTAPDAWQQPGWPPQSPPGWKSPPPRQGCWNGSPPGRRD